MVDLRTVLAAVLGILLGLVLLAYPEAVIRVHLAGRGPSGRRGEYGTDSPVPQRWRRLAQLAGGLLVAFGLYFAWQVLG